MRVGFIQSICGKRSIGIATLCAISLSTSALHASTPVTWASASDGNWGTAGNWNPAIVPDGDYDVSLSTSVLTVSLDVSASIASLKTSKTVILNTPGNQSLNAGTFSNLGGFQFSGAGSINVSGSFSNTGGTATFNNTGGRSVGEMFNDDNGTIEINGSSPFTISGTLHNLDFNSNFFLGDNATCNVGSLVNSADMHLQPGSTMNVTGGGSTIDTIPSGAEYALYQGAKLNIINGSSITDAFANVQNVLGYLHLQDGTARHWSSLNVDGLFSIRGAGTVVDVDSYTNTGNVSIGEGSILNLNNHQPITEIPFGSGYSLIGDFNVVNSGVSTPALANLHTNNGFLFIGGKDRTFGTITSNVYLEFQGGNQRINGDLINSSECWMFGESASVTVTGTLKNTKNGVLYVGLFEFLPARVIASSISNASIIRIYDGSLTTIGTGLPTLSEGLEIFSDGLLTIDLPGAASPTSTIILLDGMPVSLDGTLDLLSLNAGLVSDQQRIAILAEIMPGGITGTFDTVIGQPFPGGYWEVSYDNVLGRVYVTAQTLPEPATLGGIGLLSVVALRRVRNTPRFSRR